jgi:hypothetical protein
MVGDQLNILKNNKIKIITFFLITLLFKPLWLFNNNDLGGPGDDMSYWLHAATIAYDFDLDYRNDYLINSNLFNPNTNVPAHPPGAGYLSSPFVFLLSHIDSFVGNTESYTRINPVKSFGYLGFFISGLFYTYLGLNLLSKIANKNSNKYSKVLIFCGFLSTLNHFVLTRFLMPHSIEFFLCCSIIYLYEKDTTSKLSNYDFIKLLILYFLLAITRPSTFLYSLFLIFLYRKKFEINIARVFVYFTQISVIIMLYTMLSRKLYQNNYMLLNTYGSQAESFSSTLNMDQFWHGVIALPSLFFSTNMGIIYSTPIVFVAVFLFLTKFLPEDKQMLDKVYLSFYFAASFLPLIIWQGREVAYGQRLLIGIIPLCIVISIKYLTQTPLAIFVKFITIVNYLGYIFFYSSENLTLKPGITLWGTQVGFTAEKYYFEILKSLFNIETVLNALFRNIYVVDFFSLFNMGSLKDNSYLLDTINPKKIEQLSFYIELYQNLDINYLILVNFIIFIFSYLFTKLIFSIKSEL